MAKVSTQLARARALKGVPATKIAERSGFDASRVYAVEKGRRDARESTIEAIADALGTKLLVVDTDNRASVADAADAVRGALASGRSDWAAQVLVQVYADLLALDAFPSLAISYEKPEPVDGRWDAALAGIVEYALGQRGLPAPSWTADVPGDAKDRWDPWTGGTVTADDAEVPEPLRRRGIWIEEGELASA